MLFLCREIENLIKPDILRFLQEHTTPLHYRQARHKRTHTSTQAVPVWPHMLPASNAYGYPYRIAPLVGQHPKPFDCYAATPDGSSLWGQKIGKKAAYFPAHIGKNTVNKPQLFMCAYAYQNQYKTVSKLVQMCETCMPEKQGKNMVNKPPCISPALDSTSTVPRASLVLQ